MRLKIKYEEKHVMLYMEPESEEEEYLLDTMRRERINLVNDAVILKPDGSIKSLPFKVYVRK